MQKEKSQAEIVHSLGYLLKALKRYESFKPRTTAENKERVFIYLRAEDDSDDLGVEISKSLVEEIIQAKIQELIAEKNELIQQLK